MERIAVLIVLAAVYQCCSGNCLPEGQTGSIEAASVVGQGYNLVYANPHRLIDLGTAASDPGYADPVLVFDWKNNGIVADGIEFTNYDECRGEYFDEIVTGKAFHQQSVLANVFHEFSRGEQCKKTRFGAEYKGDLAVTRSGKPCLEWSKADETFIKKAKDKSVVTKMKNYCRNPDRNEGGPWCFTGGKSDEWEYCDIPFCAPNITIPAIRDGAFLGGTARTGEGAHDHNIHYENKLTIKFGKASYNESSARISDSVKRAVCHLPDEYQQDRYMQVIDAFGTHFINGAEIGLAFLRRRSINKQSLFDKLTKSMADHVHASHYNGKDYFAVKVTELNKSSLASTLGKPLANLHIGRLGSDKEPHILRPVTLSIVSIDEIFQHSAWKRTCEDSTFSECCERASNIAANLRKALSEYVNYKQISEPAEDHTYVGVESTWPAGFYGLPRMYQQKDSCPNPTWAGSAMSVERTHNKKKGRLFNQSVNMGHMSLWGGVFAKRAIVRNDRDYVVQRSLMKFCMKEENTQDRFVHEWMDGSYCIYQLGEMCPEGFQDGWIQWNDNDLAQFKGTLLPTHKTEGNKGKTKVHLCCRNSNTGKALLLPSSKPFSLIKLGQSCQKVDGMKAETHSFSENCTAGTCLKFNNVGGSYSTDMRNVIQPTLCRYTKEADYTKDKNRSVIPQGYKSKYTYSGTFKNFYRLILQILTDEFEI